MRIIGIGVDVIENKRIKKLIKNKNFIKRTYSMNEIKKAKNIKNKINFYSKRFAAKEAFAKTLGTGFRNDLNFKDVEILNNKIGKPYFLISRKINDLIIRRFKIKKFNLFLSISDEKDYSVAFTILQTK